MPKPFPIVSPHKESPLFDNLDKAAHEVSKDFAKNKDVEQSAALFRTPEGKYQYSTSVTNSDHDNFGMRVQMPQGTTLAGIVHSHPGNDQLAGVFSPNDINIANQLKVPSYIRFCNDNSLRRFTPGQTSATYMPGVGAHVARGDSVQLPKEDQEPDTPKSVTPVNLPPTPAAIGGPLASAGPPATALVMAAQGNQ